MIAVARPAAKALLLLLALSGCGKPAKPAAKWQGEWEVVRFESDGAVTSNSVPDMGVTVQKDLFTVWETKTQGTDEARQTVVKGFATQGYLLQFIPSASSPAQVDLVYRDGPFEGRSRRGIFAFEGDELKLSVAALGTARPTEFAGRPAPAQVLVVMKRKR